MEDHDNLTNLVENHTITKRHLEQYSEIGDPQFKEMAREKQEKREEEAQDYLYNTSKTAGALLMPRQIKKGLKQLKK